MVEAMLLLCSRIGTWSMEAVLRSARGMRWTRGIYEVPGTASRNEIPAVQTGMEECLFYYLCRTLADRGGHEAVPDQLKRRAARNGTHHPWLDPPLPGMLRGRLTLLTPQR